MRKYFELLIMFLGLCPMLMAQNIQGVVTDTKGMPISFANVVELLQADSSFVKGTVSKEDGSFMLEGVKSGNVIRVSLIGYETQYINYTGQTTVTLKLQESTNMLGEVVVKSSLPKTVLRGEGMITNIEGSVLEKTSNMEQLLSRIPNVSAKDGQCVCQRWTNRSVWSWHTCNIYQWSEDARPNGFATFATKQHKEN